MNKTCVIAPLLTLVSIRAAVVIVSELFGVIAILGLAAKPEPPSTITAFLILPLVIAVSYTHLTLPTKA